MEKKKIFCIEFLLVLILYSLVICLVPLIHSITFWIAFILSIIEYIIAGIMLIFTADTKDRNSEKIFDLIKIRNTFIYLIVQLIFNIFSMCYGKFPIWCIVIVNLVFIATLIITTYIFVYIKKYTTEFDQGVQEKVRNKKKKLVEIEQLQNIAVDYELRKSISKLIEILKYSDPISTPEVEDLEQKIEINLTVLKNLIDQGKEDDAQNCCNDLIAAVQERNNLCEIYK